MTVRHPPIKRVRWRRAYRVLPSRYPPIALFERIAEPDDWDALIEIESMTNPRIRNEIGEIQLVPAAERVSGSGASWVMGAFTHIGRPSRFSDGSYGVYYSARTRLCSVVETIYHTGKFLAATSEPPCDLDMMVLIGGIEAELHDVCTVGPRLRAIYDPNDYAASQRLARELRAAGSAGLVYRSVRLPGGECAAAFRPKAIRPLPRPERYLIYHWDGERIDRYWDYSEQQWLARPGAMSR